MREKKILVIDDDEMNLQIAKMVLERKLPCKVVAADNGVEGIDILKSQHVDLVLLDVLMPDFDGVETLQEIRGDEQIKNVAVMMLTASSDKETIKRVGALGVRDYIKKPFLPADLIARVEKKLAEQAANEEVILLLGDDEKKLQLMQKLVEEEFSKDCLTATSTNATEKILHEANVRLIVTCADMKFINGVKFLSLIASEEEFNSVPLAVTTPEKLVELLEKINAPEIEEEPAPPVVEEKTSPPEVEEKSSPPEPEVKKEKEKPIVSPEEKHKLAKVVTNLIGYSLDRKI